MIHKNFRLDFPVKSPGRKEDLELFFTESCCFTGKKRFEVQKKFHVIPFECGAPGAFLFMHIINNVEPEIKSVRPVSDLHGTGNILRSLEFENLIAALFASAGCKGHFIFDIRPVGSGKTAVNDDTRVLLETDGNDFFCTTQKSR